MYVCIYEKSGKCRSMRLITKSIAQIQFCPLINEDTKAPLPSVKDNGNDISMKTWVIHTMYAAVS